MPLPLLGLLGAAKGAGLAAKGAGLAAKGGGLLSKLGGAGDLLGKGAELASGIGGKEKGGEGEQQVADKGPSKKDKKKTETALNKLFSGGPLDGKEIEQLNKQGILDKALALKSAAKDGKGPSAGLPTTA